MIAWGDACTTPSRSAIYRESGRDWITSTKYTGTSCCSRLRERISSNAIPLVGQIGLCLYTMANGCASASATSASLAIFCTSTSHLLALCQPHTLEHPLKPGIVPNRVEHQLDLEIREPTAPVLVRLVHPFERPVPLIERNIQLRLRHRRHVARSGFRIQLPQNRQRFVYSATSD